MGDIIGHDLHTGLLGCANNVSDWAIRTAAVKGLKAVCITAGLLIKPEQCKMILGVLNKVKHDKVKPVRMATTDTLAVYMELQVF